jgi:NADH-quinone oxidoreductase subunit L
MGGLRKHIPITHMTFAIATFAIAGFPIAAGFFSKDEILASALATPHFATLGKVVWAMGTIAALFTAFYMYRLYYLTFAGEFRGTHEQEHHLHESPKTMTIPLIVLAGLSIVGGFLGIPHLIGHSIHVPHFLEHWLEPVLTKVAGVREGSFAVAAQPEIIVMAGSTLLALAGWWFARSRYATDGVATDEAFHLKMPGVQSTLENKYWIDELYDAVIVDPLNRLSVFFWKIIDAIIDGLLSLGAYFIAALGDIIRFLQTGNVRNYALMLFLGVVVFIWVYV